MKEELNLPCPYKVTLDTQTFIYSFITKNLIEYNVTFADSVYLFDGTSAQHHITKVYTLNIEKISLAIEPLDFNVRKTIDGIITHFFIDPENSIIYLCDAGDKKELLRRNKFNDWYAKSHHKNEVSKIDESIIVDQDTIYYTCLLYHNQNPFKEALQNSYNEVIASLKDK